MLKDNIESEYILEVNNICKKFGGVIALDDINLKVKRGEILGIVGDNGAGKSTLIKIISGILSKDSGKIFFNGNKVEINNATDAKKIGIETVYQDLALIDIFDIPLNIFLGREIVYENLFGKITKVVNYKKMKSKTIDSFAKYNIEILNLDKPIFNYSGGQRQAVALARAAFWGSKLIILDEPTASLGLKESKNALELIKNLNKNGLTIIIISHNLQHVFSIVDRIFVLRQSKEVGIRKINETSFDEIVSMITGAKVVEKIEY